ANLAASARFVAAQGSKPACLERIGADSIIPTLRCPRVPARKRIQLIPSSTPSPSGEQRAVRFSLIESVAISRALKDQSVGPHGCPSTWLRRTVAASATMASVPAVQSLLLLLLFLLLSLRGTAVPARSACTKTCDLFSQECLDEQCICKRTCRSTGHESRVCTKKGFEYQSRCHFFRDQCLCKSRSGDCQHQGVEKDYILMYSACRRTAGFSRATNSETVAARPLSDPQCDNYSSRLAAWLSYALTLKLSESMVSLHDFEADEYTNGLYTNELLVFAPLSHRARRTVELLNFYPVETVQFDNRIPSMWFCLLDSDINGWLDEKEMDQLTRVLLPQDACIEAFLTGCLQGGRSAGLAAWQGPDCFRLREGDIQPSCDL
uniref:SPARC_Ca_bdg domain-containing protein n=2 Tax=Macrostomum lignano TaxID=282301 RepID=A0A1I8GHH5_9PLAT